MNDIVIFYFIHFTKISINFQELYSIYLNSLKEFATNSRNLHSKNDILILADNRREKFYRCKLFFTYVKFSLLIVTIISYRFPPRKDLSQKENLNSMQINFLWS